MCAHHIQPKIIKTKRGKSKHTTLYKIRRAEVKKEEAEENEAKGGKYGSREQQFHALLPRKGVRRAQQAGATRISLDKNRTITSRESDFPQVERMHDEADKEAE